MPVKKITISLDAQLADELSRDAKDDGDSVSAWVARAIESQLRSHRLREMLDEYQAEFGAFTEEEREATRKFWQESLSTPEPSSLSNGEIVASGDSSTTSSKRKAS